MSIIRVAAYPISSIHSGRDRRCVHATSPDSKYPNHHRGTGGIPDG